MTLKYRVYALCAPRIDAFYACGVYSLQFMAIKTPYLIRFCTDCLQPGVKKADEKKSTRDVERLGLVVNMLCRAELRSI